MGERQSDIKSVRILSRIVTWTSEGAEYESDQGHAEIIVNQMGLKENVEAVATPAIRVKACDVLGDRKEIEPREQTIYTGVEQEPPT